MDPNTWVGGGITLGGALLAVLATLRYVKNTEDDSVAGLRQTVSHMEGQLALCRRESEQMHRQINRLVEAFRLSGLPFPDGFWDQVDG